MHSILHELPTLSLQMERSIRVASTSASSGMVSCKTLLNLMLMESTGIFLVVRAMNFSSLDDIF